MMYCIAIQKDIQGNITKLRITNSLETGSPYQDFLVSTIMDNILIFGYQYYTAVQINRNQYIKGQKITVIQENFNSYLRTNQNRLLPDNLDQLPEF